MSPTALPVISDNLVMSKWIRTDRENTRQDNIFVVFIAWNMSSSAGVVTVVVILEVVFMVKIA